MKDENAHLRAIIAAAHGALTDAGVEVPGLDEDISGAIRELAAYRDRLLKQNHAMAKGAIDRLWTDVTEKLKQERDELRSRIDGAVTMTLGKTKGHPYSSTGDWISTGLEMLRNMHPGETRTFKLVPVIGSETARTGQEPTP